MDINALFKSNYLKAADFPEPARMTIAQIVVEEVGQEKESKPVIYFNGDDRGLVLNRTNASMIAHSYGNDTDRWIGKPLELHSEPVSFQGRVVDAIRVRAAPVRRAAPAPAADEFADSDIPW